jgi:cobaltochelatase CobN
MVHLKVALATTIPSDVIPALNAVKAINEKTPNTIEFCLRTGGDFRDFGTLDDFINFSKTAHIVLVHLMGDLPEMDKLIEALKTAKIPLMISASFHGAKDYNKYSTIEPEDRRKIFYYLNYGGKKNYENLLYYLANRFTGANCTYEAPIKPIWEGIYHPDFNDSIPTLSEYMKKKVDPNRVTVGLWFHQNHWQGGNTSFVDNIIREIEKQGANVLPVFFSGSKNEKLGMNGLEWVIDNYFLKDGKPTVNVVVSLFSFSFTTCLSGSEASGVLKKLNVPVIKAILTCNTEREWRESIQGLSIMDIPANVALPELAVP